MRALIIEDHLGERINIVKAIQPFSFDVETAVTFERARELISKRNFQLVVCEQQLKHGSELQGDGLEIWTLYQRLNPQGCFVMLSLSASSVALEVMKMNLSTPTIIDKPLHTQQLNGIIMQRIINATHNVNRAA